MKQNLEQCAAATVSFHSIGAPTMICLVQKHNSLQKLGVMQKPSIVENVRPILLTKPTKTCSMSELFILSVLKNLFHNIHGEFNRAQL
jgi:hypothetical protein